MASPTLESLERLADAGALTGAAPRKRMLVIVNPYATTVSDRLKSLVVYALRGRYDVHAVDTQRRRHATQLCREAAREGYDLVVAFGGDGTVNEAANGLVGSDTALSVLPGGRTNVYCRVLGIPPEIVDATEHLLRLADDFDPRRVDVARVNGRCFTFTAGLGLDASVVERVDSHPRAEGADGRLLLHLRGGDDLRAPLPRRASADRGRGRRRALRGVTAIVQNLEPYTYFNDRPIEVAEGVAPQDGTLAGAVLERADPVDMPTVAWRAFSRRARILRHRRVHGFSGVTELSACSLDDRPVPLQVDGDHVDDVLHATYDVLPRALLVVAEPMSAPVDPDPNAPGRQRWWDGAQWTTHTAPGGPAAPYGAPAGPGAPAPYAPRQPMSAEQSRQWAMVAHLSALGGYLVGGFAFLGPLIVYLIKKDEDAFVADQAREALNFNLSFLLYLVVLGVVTFVLIFLIVGLFLIPLLIALAIAHVVLVIIAGVQANKGIAYRYPLTIRFDHHLSTARPSPEPSAERDLADQRRARTGRAVELEAAAQRLEAVGQPAHPRAALQPRAADAVVAHLDAYAVAAARDAHAGAACTRVLGDVGRASAMR